MQTKEISQIKRDMEKYKEALAYTRNSLLKENEYRREVNELLIESERRRVDNMNYVSEKLVSIVSRYLDESPRSITVSSGESHLLYSLNELIAETHRRASRSAK